MVYQGSKAKLRKDLLPILQNCINENHIENYYEPFCGRCNMIDHIQCKNRIGSDINSELIELLKYMRDNPTLDIFPQDCSFEHYADVRENRKNKTNKYSVAYTSGIGYFASFGGRYFDGGYGKDPSGKRNIYRERLDYAKEQAPLLKGIEFGVHSFEDYNPNDFSGCLFYLDHLTEIQKYMTVKMDFLMRNFTIGVRNLERTIGFLFLNIICHLISNVFGVRKEK